MKLDTNKIKSVHSFAAPKITRKRSRYIGIWSYYQHFILNFSTIADPLIELTYKYG